MILSDPNSHLKLVSNAFYWNVITLDTFLRSLHIFLHSSLPLP